MLYAVKCNPDPTVLRALWAGGVRHFDCASINEVALVRQMFADADIHFMHPVKARGAIREAWARHGVRDFVLDSAGELEKILEEVKATGIARRRSASSCGLRCPKGGAVLDLSGKFGAETGDAAALLRAARPHAARLGVAFHVGSQCLDPLAWRAAFAIVAGVIAAAGVAIDIVDVGGGFPVRYPEQEPAPLGAFMAEIEAGFERLGLPDARLWAEPGRALVATGGSVVVQVQARRGDALYINDGVYGSLADAGVLGFRYPVRCIRPEAPRHRTRCATSASSARPATARTRCADRSCCPTTSVRATGSKSSSSGPTAPACAPASTASTAPALPRWKTRRGQPCAGASRRGLTTTRAQGDHTVTIHVPLRRPSGDARLRQHRPGRAAADPTPHREYRASAFSIVTADDARRRGRRRVRRRAHGMPLTRDNYRDVLTPAAPARRLPAEFSVDVSSVALVQLCRDRRTLSGHLRRTLGRRLYRSVASASSGAITHYAKVHWR